MKQATGKKEKQFSDTLVKGLREGALYIFGAVAVFLLIALFSHNAQDPGWTHQGMSGQVVNKGGVAGAWFADVFLSFFGYLAYFFPLIVAYGGWLIYRKQHSNAQAAAQKNDWFPLWIRLGGCFLAFSTGAALTAMHITAAGPGGGFLSGGWLGDFIASALVAAFSATGATLILLALFLSSITLFTGFSWLWVLDETGKWSLRMFALSHSKTQQLNEALRERKVRRQREKKVELVRQKISHKKPPRIESAKRKPEISARAEKEKQVPLFDQSADGRLPPLSLLDEVVESVQQISHSALEMMSRQVEAKLNEFGVSVEVVAVHPGPVITRYELQLAAGVKVSQIANLAKDLARALAAPSVRIVEVIPGKPVIGIEIPNESIEIVYLRDVLETAQYDDSSSTISLVLGKDISGKAMVADLSKMPHLLVAGTTGAGKSVALNVMILSLLYNNTPNEIRLILIDPKMLELSVYEDIPHLLTPVVTDMKDAANALRWCVAEMERRYKLMAALGVRNLKGYNRKVKDAKDSGQPLKDPFYTPLEDGEERFLETMPCIVIIIDEFADMMMVVGKKVEQLINRLAQKARAAGVHLILATQRPSVDVITGLIKANIPARIAFQVSSRIDSRTILDQMGAEQLLGHGDMLYLASGSSVPTRVHGAYVTDQEVHRVANYLRKSGQADYVAGVTDGAAESESGRMQDYMDDEKDALYDEALYIVTETRKASISGVQRRLKIGYNRAARIIESMEQEGVVGPVQSNGMREVLAPPPVKE